MQLQQRLWQQRRVHFSSLRTAQRLGTSLALSLAPALGDLTRLAPLTFCARTQLANDTSGACANPSAGGGCIDLWRYNIVANKWDNSFDYPQNGGGSGWPSNPSGYPPQPFTFTSGGMVLAMDELAPNVLYAIDSIAFNGAGWRAVSGFTPIPLGSRWGQRFLSWGSTVFMCVL